MKARSEKMANAGTPATYSVGAVARITGLSSHVIRAWERRYGAVEPLRTEAGTRRYRDSDVARLRLLKAAAEAGNPIRDLARLPDEELQGRIDSIQIGSEVPLAPLLAALDALDAQTAEARLSFQLSALGARRFVTDVATPLLHEIGRLWKSDQMCIASEHLASSILRSLLGACLRERSPHQEHPILFTSPAGERHELGLLMAAVLSLDAGGQPVVLGADLPLDEVVMAARRTNAAAVALGITQLEPARAEVAVREARLALPAAVELWVGGGGCAELSLPDDVFRVHTPEDIEQRVGLLGRRAVTS